MARVFRDPAGALFNLLAIGYAVGGFGAGLYLTTRPSLAWNAFGTLLLSHGMVIAAYLIHEFAHGSIFARKAWNEFFGGLMSWLTGGCYATFDQIRFKHVRHHADRLDIVTFDYRAFLQRYPRIRRVVLALEWAYIPAVELLMHLFVIALPFYSPHHYHRRYRLRVVSVAALRLSLFAGLALYAPKALLFYAVAWMGMVLVLRFNDAFQHTYPVVPQLARERPADLERPDHAFELRNTYSNLASRRRPWLNLLVLNFTYHNAHHEKPSVPWYRLPRLHRELFGEDDSQVVTWSQLFGLFHRGRSRRVMAEDYGTVERGLSRPAEQFVGAVGVSFLTSV